MREECTERKLASLQLLNCRAGRDLQEASPVLFGEIARAREMKVTARPAREPQSAKSASCQH